VLATNLEVIVEDVASDRIRLGMCGRQWPFEIGVKVCLLGKTYGLEGLRIKKLIGVCVRFVD
jgi:hypothetical protein